MECSRPKGIKPKMRECKLRSGINWQEVLKHKGVKQMGIKEGLGILSCEGDLISSTVSPFVCLQAVATFCKHFTVTELDNGHTYFIAM
jgi:hypothetical protein